MRQKWAVLAILVVVMALALSGNQMLAAKVSTTDGGATTLDGGTGLAGAANTEQTTAETNQTTTAATKVPQVLEHVVASGETLGGIAAKYGTDTTTLKSLNSIKDGNSLRVGQRLVVLTVPGVLHKVVSGDTLWDIARDYGVSLTAIYEANPGLQGSALKMGQKLILPGAKPKVKVVQPTQVSRGGAVDRSTSQSSTTNNTSTGFRWPLTGTITSGYGQRWGKLHAGLDIGVPTGTSVRAAAGGTVTYAGWAVSYGYLVKIKHSNGYETRYGHNSQILVKVGQQVSKGQVIAKSGSTGFSTGPHLHFEVRKNGTTVNPLSVLP